MLALGVGACGDDKGTKNNEEKVSAPGTGDSSSLFKVALPKGAVQVSTGEGTETYRAKEGDSLRELQEFYDKEMSGKPFGEYEWCGGSSDMTNTKAVILWRKAGTNDLFKLGLDANDPAGIVITASTEANAPETTCPPGPVDSIPDYDPGDLPGV